MLNLNCVGALVHFDVLMFKVIYDVKPHLVKVEGNLHMIHLVQLLTGVLVGQK